MSDFEVAIKQEFVHQFPAVKPKGCSFHFIKVFITKVQKSGFKADYARKEKIAFRSFIRAVLGLVYCPLERFKEAIRNVYILAKCHSSTQVCSSHDQLRSPLLGKWLSSPGGVEHVPP